METNEHSQSDDVDANQRLAFISHRNNSEQGAVQVSSLRLQPLFCVFRL